MQWVLVAVTVVLDMSCKCRSELARDGPENTAGHQTPRVIVDDHREQARSYRKGGD